LGDHVRTAGGALKNWFLAQTCDALAVAGLWLAGMLVLHVPGWFVWAPLAFLLQYIPHYGPILSLLGPAVAGGLSGGWKRLLYVLILYALIVLIDGFILQPLLVNRAAQVPVWASLTVPLVMGLAFNFWGVLLAPPLLAVFFAYWNKRKRSRRTEAPASRGDFESDKSQDRVL
jgi:predicted PurR-regulated permease PerM